MIEKEQLGALYAVAQEQQTATANAVAALQEQTGAVNAAVKVLGQTAALVANLPAQVTASSAKAIREEVRHAVSEALSATADQVTAAATERAEIAAKGFQATAKNAAQAATNAAEAAQQAVRDSNWLFIAFVFVAGLAIGAAGLYLLHTPKAGEIYLDTAKVAQEVAAVCRKR